MEFYENALKQDKIYTFEILHGSVHSHSHDFFELAYIKEGEIYHIINGKKYKVSKGNYFIINTNDFHEYIRIKSSKCVIANCLFYPEFIDITMKHCKNFSQLIESYMIKFNQSILSFNPTAYLFYDNDGNIKTLIDKISAEYRNKNHGHTELARCFLTEILIATMRKITNNEKVLQKNNPIKYITEYIEKNYNNDIKLTDLSKELNYSLSYISSKFKNDTGFSFTEYLQKYRINQSCVLLAETCKKITEISESVGYDDTKFFTDIFKRYMGVTPRRFRQNCKSGK